MSRTAWAFGLAGLTLALLALATPAQAAELFTPYPGEAVSGDALVWWDREEAGSSLQVTMHVSGLEIRPELCDECPGSYLFLDTTAYSDGDEYSIELDERGLGNDDGPGNNGRVRTTMLGTFTIDNTSPSTGHRLVGDLGWAGYYVSDVVLELFPEDATSGVSATWIKVDSQPWAFFDGDPITVRGDGSHSVRFYSIDRAGNGEAMQQVDFFIDTVGPNTVPSISGTLGANDWFTSPVSVSLSATSDEAPVTATYGSVNGDPYSTMAGAYFPLDGEQSLHFYSTDAAGHTEAVDSVHFRIDQTAPETTITLDAATGDNGYYVEDVTFTLDASDGGSGVAETQVRVDGGPYVPYADSIRVSGQGTHTVYFTSRDQAGNWEDTRSASFTIDTLGPETTSALTGTMGDNDWFTSAVAVTLTAAADEAPVAGTWYSLNGDPFTPYSGTFLVAADGDHDVRYYSADTAGHVESVDTISFRIDQTRPSSTSVLEGATGDNGYFLEEVSVVLSAHDGASGIRDIFAKVDGASAMLYEDSLRVTGEGSHTVEFWSVDHAGNTEFVRSISFLIDSVAPDTLGALAGPMGDNDWFIGDVTVTLTTTDATSDVAATWFSLDGDPFQTYSGPIAVSPDGDHDVRFFSVDGAGNTEAIDQVTFRIDAAVPFTDSVQDGLTGDNDYYLGDVTVTLTNGDDTSGVRDSYASVDGGVAFAYTDSLRVTGDGPHSVAFWSVDHAGNVEPTQTITFDIDATHPETGSGLAGVIGDDDWYVGPVTVTLSPFDATSGLEDTTLSHNDDPFASYGGPMLIGTDGDHTVHFYSDDMAGNTEPEDFTTFRIDQVAPETTADVIGHLGLEGWHLTEVSVSLAATDATSGVRDTLLSLDGAPAGPYTGTLVEVADGPHTVDYWSIDVAGNVEQTLQVAFSIDRTDPISALSIGSPSDDQGEVWFLRSDTPLSLSATDAMSGVDRIEYRLQDGPFIPYTEPFFITGRDGGYLVEWRAVDNAGNVEVTQIQHFELDNTAPELELRRPQAGGLYFENTFVVETHPALAEAFEISVGDISVYADTLPFGIVTGDLTLKTDTDDAGVGVRDVQYFIDSIHRATVSEAPYEWTWDSGKELLGWHEVTTVSTDILGTADSRSQWVFVVPTELEGVALTVDTLTGYVTDGFGLDPLPSFQELSEEYELYYLDERVEGVIMDPSSAVPEGPPEIPEAPEAPALP